MLVLTNTANTARPRRFVLAWMAALSSAAGISAMLYLDELYANKMAHGHSWEQA